MTEALKKALEGNEDLLSEVTSFETAATANADKVQGLERDIKKAVDKRDSLKEMIRKATGLSEITEEALSKLGNGDDALKSEVMTLQEKLEATIGERDGLAGKHQHEINSMRMLDSLRSMGVDQEVWNPKAFEAVANMMLDGAEYTDGTFQYKGEDGATVYGDGGKPLSVQEKLSRLKTDENVYQFKPVKGGGGGQGNDLGTASVQSSGKASTLDNARAKAAFIGKHGSLDGFK